MEVVRVRVLSWPKVLIYVYAWLSGEGRVTEVTMQGYEMQQYTVPRFLEIHALPPYTVLPDLAVDGVAR